MRYIRHRTDTEIAVTLHIGLRQKADPLVAAVINDILQVPLPTI
jgi:hypothetical protein